VVELGLRQPQIVEARFGKLAAQQRTPDSG